MIVIFGQVPCTRCSKSLPNEYHICALDKIIHFVFFFYTMLEALCFEIFIIQVVFIGLKVHQGLFSLAIAFLSLLLAQKKI